MTAMDQITDETVALIRKAQTAGIVYADGVYGYDLSGVVSWVPVETPTRDRVTRRQAPVGSDAARWRTMLNINGSQPNPFTGQDGVGSDVNFNFHTMLSNYYPVRTRGHVTLDSIDASRGYDDVRARSLAGTLMQWRIMDNKAIIGGQNWALPALTLNATPLATATTGGQIAATTAVYVKVQARSGYNYYWGGSGAAVAANITTGSGSTNSVTINTWSNPGNAAVAYDIFAGPSAGTLYYVTTVTTNAAYTLTAIPVANAAVPALPSINATVPTPAASDGSASANSFNGLFASVLGDYLSSGVQATPGSGDLASGAYVKSLGGAALTANGQAVNEIDAALQSYFNNTGGLTPTTMLMSQATSGVIKNLVLSTSAATTYLEPQGDSRVGVTVGGSVLRYIAPSGQSVEIVIDPHFPQGRILFLRDSNPYPEAGQANNYEVRTLREVSENPLANPYTSTPGEWWDVSSNQTFINRAPVMNALITDIGGGA